MDLIFIRHAIAQDRRTFSRKGRPDSERPLTAEGVRKFRRSLKGLRRILPHIDLLATSPYTRARQTCKLASEVYSQADVVTLPALVHKGNLPDIISWLQRQKRSAVVALVGHEPDMGKLAAKLTRASAPPVVFKKGGVGLMSFEGRAGVGLGSFLWLLTPALMKRLR
jgi:phosphohistidine phosphatase